MGLQMIRELAGVLVRTSTNIALKRFFPCMGVRMVTEGLLGLVAFPTLDALIFFLLVVEDVHVPPEVEFSPKRPVAVGFDTKERLFPSDNLKICHAL